MKELTTVLSRKFTCARCITIGIGIVYFWFGMLKFFVGLSPAEDLAIATINQLTFGMLGPVLSLYLLAAWEVGVGILLITGFSKSIALKAALIHIIFTFTPLVFFPELCFTKFPFGLTLVGQYIIKNVVFLAVMVYFIRKED